MKNLQIIQNDDGVFDVYDDTYDITIHCTSQEEQDNVLKKLNREECSDAISRQAVLEVIEKCHCEEWVKADIGAPIEALQPVTPAEKVGRWIIKMRVNKKIMVAGGKKWYIQIMCDKCGFIKTIMEKYKGQYKFCPNCGQPKMQEVEE